MFSFKSILMLFATILVLNFNSLTASEESRSKISIEELKILNQEFVNGKIKKHDFIKQRKEQSKGQKPHTIVVTCSDSRLAPEHIFNQGLGDIFVVRTAGNVIDSVVLGSIEYAAEHLKASNIIILGHTSCGAVTAALKGQTESPFINSILYKIFPAVELVKSKDIHDTDLLLATIYQNVKNQLITLHESKILTELFEKNELESFGAIYDISSGKVEFIK